MNLEKEELIVVMTTFGSMAEANKGVQQLVSEGWVACAQVLPAIMSHYRWEGKMQKEEEVLVLLKTGRRKFSGLEQKLNEIHPYDVPEIIALPVAEVSSSYLGFVTDALKDY